MQWRNDWFHERVSLARDGWESVVDTETPGWAHTGLRVAELVGVGRLLLPAGEIERIVVPLAGSFAVAWTSGSAEEGTTTLLGRISVFDGPLAVLYLGVGTSATIVTAVAEGIKIIVVLIQNHGYASIGHLSETVGSERFGTRYRVLDGERKNFDGEQILPIDLAANARSYGVAVIEIEPGESAIDDLKAAMVVAKASDRTTLIHIHSDPLLYAPDGEGWWDVPVSSVSELESTRAAFERYSVVKSTQKPLLGRAEPREELSGEKT